MLVAFVNAWEEISPTIITGWNIDFFDVTYLYNRLKRVLGTKQANRLSPIGKVHWNKYRKRYIIAGVSALDYIALYKCYTYFSLFYLSVELTISILKFSSKPIFFN